MQPQKTVATVGTIPATSPVASPVPIGLDWAVLLPLIFAGLALLITTTGNLIVSYRNGKKSDVNSEKADAIHVLVNSNMTKALADLAAAQEEIRSLRAVVVSLTARLATTEPPSLSGSALP
jgi:hypothetical protein